MKVVNPIGRKADDMERVEKASCRCEISSVYSKGQNGVMGSRCYCWSTSTTSQAVKNG